MSVADVQETFPPLPLISVELMKALDKRFPDRCPDPLFTEREIWMRVGERRLIRFLLDQFNRQQENILNKR